MALVVFTPLQYILIAVGQIRHPFRDTAVDLYGIYSIMIPVYASLFIPSLIAVAERQQAFPGAHGADPSWPADLRFIRSAMPLHCCICH